MKTLLCMFCAAAQMLFVHSLPANPPGADQGVRGPYLGQRPPGLVAVPFAAEVLTVAGKNQHTLSFSADGRELYFTHNPDRVTLVMRRTEDGWGAPERASFDGWEAQFSPDGRSLLFGNGDLWVTERSDAGWRPAEKLPAAINTPDYEYYATIAADGTLYFSRLANGQARILRARRVGGSYDTPEALGPAINAAGAYHPFVAKDGSYLLFNSRDRADGFGGADLYVSFRGPDGTFGAPVNLGPAVNSKDVDVTPVVSPDGAYLFFTRLRDGTGVPHWVSSQVIEAARTRAGQGAALRE